MLYSAVWFTIPCKPTLYGTRSSVPYKKYHALLHYTELSRPREAEHLHMLAELFSSASMAGRVPTCLGSEGKFASTFATGSSSTLGALDLGSLCNAMYPPLKLQIQARTSTLSLNAC